VPSLIALGVIFWLRFPRLGLLLVAAGIAIFAIKFSSILNLVSTDTQGTLFPLYARLAAWQIALQATSPNWLFGLGPSNYYNAVELYPILGYNVRFSSHNNYVDLVAQTGLLGLAAFFWFVAAYAREAWSLRFRPADGFARTYVNACLGALVAMLAAGFLGDWFLPFVYNVGLKGFRASVLGWLFLGGVIAIKGIVERERAVQVE
jgi:O-antigen ligase